MQKPGAKAPRAKAADKSAAENLPPEEFGEECGGKGGVPYQVFVRPGERITRVTVWHRDYVDGIELVTDKAPLPKIGGTGKSRDIREDSFELESGEFLTGLSVEFWNYLDRITFHTNKRSYGPFGGTAGRVKKELRAPEGRIVVGFKGRHWAVVDSIRLLVGSIE
jgi:hypothetical protein